MPRTCQFCKGDLPPGETAYCSTLCRLLNHVSSTFWASVQANPGKPKIAHLPLLRMTRDQPQWHR